MDHVATVRGLMAFERRGAGTDAERRAASWLAAQLRELGREAELETVWVRPFWAPAYTLYALLGVIGSLLTEVSAVAGIAILAATIASVLLDVAGLPSPVRRATPERATQNVVSPPTGAREGRVRLVLAAPYDAPRGGLFYRDPPQRLLAAVRRRTRGVLPGGAGWLTLALLALLAVAALHRFDISGRWLGAVQLVPTILLIIAVVVLADIALSSPGGGTARAAGAAAALAVADALGQAPPERLDVEVVLGGAGDGPALGMRAYVRSRKRRLQARDVAVISFGACGTGAPRWLTSDGPLVPARFHPRLVALAAQVARGEQHLGAQPRRGRGTSAARVARGASWPALALECRTARDTAPDPADPDADALRDVVELALGLIDALDRELATAA